MEEPYLSDWNDQRPLPPIEGDDDEILEIEPPKTARVDQQPLPPIEGDDDEIPLIEEDRIIELPQTARVDYEEAPPVRESFSVVRVLSECALIGGTEDILPLLRKYSRYLGTPLSAVQVLDPILPKDRQVLLTNNPSASCVDFLGYIITEYKSTPRVFLPKLRAFSHALSAMETSHADTFRERKPSDHARNAAHWAPLSLTGCADSFSAPSALNAPCQYSAQV